VAPLLAAFIEPEQVERTLTERFSAIHEVDGGVLAGRVQAQAAPPQAPRNYSSFS
jgi:hypothetical protein